MKKVLIVINVSKDESMSLSQEISAFLKEKGIETDFLDFDGFCSNVPIKNYAFVITLGGDGTVLFAARNAVDYGVPIFPINLGQFGFIASVQPSEWKECLTSFLKNKSPVEQRAMLSVEVQRKKKTVYSSLGLNDVVICATRAATIISLIIKYDNQHLCRLNSDGVIVSTSTGSTAYSAAAGGPIVAPNLNAFVITPINSFSLSSRPIVLNPEADISISVDNSRTKEISITIDGQEPFALKKDDVVIIRQNKKRIKLVSSSKDNFYNALRSKLNWSGGPHA